MSIPAQFQTIAATLVGRAQDVQHVEEMAGGIYVLCGTIEFAGYGEVIMPVNFPITFIEKPNISSGWESAPSSFFQNGGIPIVSGGVWDWKFDARADTGQQLYSGASFAVYVGGQPEQVILWHYRLEARALRNPV